jgi:sirohydrochlorin cobaltochelatase
LLIALPDGEMAVDEALDALLSQGGWFGQLLIQKQDCGFVLCHRDDAKSPDLKTLTSPKDALEVARFDDAGNFRSLKTAPNLRRGWKLELANFSELRHALDCFYPGRLALFTAWRQNRLSTTALRETLNRQTGMYRVAAKISNEQIDGVVERVCRSDGGCLRAILWRRDKEGAIPATRLPPGKFDPVHDQTGRGESTIPLLCQEGCAVLINECRRAVKTENA